MSYNNDKTLITTIYGIGAYFASCSSALNVALRDGIHWYPYPLVPYCNEALQLILDYLLDDEPNSWMIQRQLQVQIAAIRALESILMVSPITSLTPERINEVPVVTCYIHTIKKYFVVTGRITERVRRNVWNIAGTSIGRRSRTRIVRRCNSKQSALNALGKCPPILLRLVTTLDPDAGAKCINLPTQSAITRQKQPHIA